jgi:hypothetical protein
MTDPLHCIFIFHRKRIRLQDVPGEGAGHNTRGLATFYVARVLPGMFRGRLSRT